MKYYCNSIDFVFDTFSVVRELPNAETYPELYYRLPKIEPIKITLRAESSFEKEANYSFEEYRKVRILFFDGPRWVWERVR